MEIDGSMKSGSGTILRVATALAAILGENLHIYNIRKKRRQPGLRPQHLEAVLTAAKLANAEAEGAELGSQEVWFRPGKIGGGEVRAEIGTAGSIPMLLLTVLPICAFAEKPVTLRVSKGGTDVRYSPTINYLRLILLPTLEKMGLKAEAEVNRFGYYPVGNGEVTLRVEPCRRLLPLQLAASGRVEEVDGVSVATFLKDRRVAERQAESARKRLETRGYTAEVEAVYDSSNPLQKGSSIALRAMASGGILLGSDCIGELGKPSERVGAEAAEKLLAELESGATADVHLADMVVPYVALAEGESTYTARALTEHLETNLWLAGEVTGRKLQLRKIGKLYEVRAV